MQATLTYHEENNLGIQTRNTRREKVNSTEVNHTMDEKTHYVFMRNFLPQHMIEPGEFVIIVGPSKAQRDDVAARLLPRYDDHFCFSETEPKDDILKCGGKGAANDMEALQAYLSTKKGNQTPFSVVHLDVKNCDQFISSNVGKNLVLNGKCLSALFIVTASYMKDVPCFARANASVIMFLKDTSRHNQEAIFEETRALFPNFDCFQKAFTQCTAENAALVVCNRTFAPSPEKCLFWFKVPGL